MSLIKAIVDPRGLGLLEARLADVASGKVAREANKELAGVYQGYVDEQFAKGRSPYGERWDAPLDGGRPGWRSGDLARSTKVKAAGATIRMTAGVDYARYFIRSGRDIFPNAADGLPPKWRTAAERVHRAAARRALRAR